MADTQALLSDEENIDEKEMEKEIEKKVQYKNGQMSEEENEMVIESDNELDEESVLNLAASDLKEIPSDLAKNKGPSITTLILTKNKIQSLKNLEYFPNIQTLQLDRNGIQSIDDMPKLNNLKTLWLNNNKLNNLQQLLTVLRKQCPSLEYLSLLLNPVCPAMDGTSSSSLHNRYRFTVIYTLSKIKFLDTEEVTLKEKQEAAKRGKFLSVAKPNKADMAQVEEDIEQEINEDVSPYKNAAPAAFLGKGRIKYDGRESEGNRFILNQDL